MPVEILEMVLWAPFRIRNPGLDAGPGLLILGGPPLRMGREIRDGGVPADAGSAVDLRCSRI